MIKAKYLLGFLSLGALLVGCSEDNFDKRPSETISDKNLQDQYKKDPSVIDGMIRGAYFMLFKTGSGGTTGHSDFGQKSVDISTDILSGDMAQKKSSYGHFYNNEELLSTTRTSGTNEMYWKYYFKVVKSCNDILSLFFENDTEQPKENQAKWGQAKALRAYAYYNLAMMYSKGYSSPDDLCVPIYNVKNMDVAAPLSSVRKVLEFAKKDLEDAVVALAGFKRDGKYQIDEYVASGMLSYVYLTVGEYDKAIASADKVLAAYKPMTALEVTGGLNSIAAPSLMWGVDITNENSGSLVTFWGHMDIYTYSYVLAGARKTIDKGLYDQISAQDVRKYQFGSSSLLPLWKFYDKGRVNGGDRKWENDIFWMRADEFILVKAEAQARSGKAGDASTTLNTLLSKRAAVEGTPGCFPAGTPAGAPTYDMTNILDAVYLQWRIETWGEGRSLSIMKRFQKSVKRGVNHSEYPGAVISYDDPRLTFAIPEVEAVNNPNF